MPRSLSIISWHANLPTELPSPIAFARMSGDAGPCKASMLVLSERLSMVIEPSSGSNEVNQSSITGTIEAFGTPRTSVSDFTANIMSSIMWPL